MLHLLRHYLTRRMPALAQGALVGLLALAAAPQAFAAPPPVAIAQYPLTVAEPAHPQVLLAVANSQSMDANLTTGAIQTGSGGLPANYSGLNASSSPTQYTVQAGFTAPVTGTTSGNLAPYTVNTSGTLYDNSDSRLNVAKAGINLILNTFLADADFALIDYQVQGLNPSYTWVYYMSPPGADFSFTNTQNVALTYVTNPCFGINQDGANPVDNSCLQLAGRYGTSIKNFQWMQVGDTSDEADISDVLYDPGLLEPVFVTWGNPNPNPLDPFTHFSLGNYNNNGVEECYPNSIYGTFCETPTNAGYVPYSPTVMNVLRGFGYYTNSQTATPGGGTTNSANWQPVLNMQSAGQSPTQASVNTVVSTFQTYLNPETNAGGTPEIKAEATQSPIAGLLQASHDYYVNKNPATSNGCAANRYVVLVTDGLPTMDLSGHSWPPLGSIAASNAPAGWSVTATFNGDGSLNTTNSQALTDTITTIASLKAAGIKTYIIALGADVAGYTGIVDQTLTSMAVAGGSNNYYSALSAAQLNAAMQTILAKILAETAATSASSINSTGINTTSIAYQGVFDTSDSFQDWTGNLEAFPINTTTGQINTATSADTWGIGGAQTILDLQDWFIGRQIVTWDPVAGAGTPFRWNPSTTATQGIASSTALGVALESFPYDTNGQDVLQFLRGSNAQEVRNGGQFRNRTHKLGDIVDSSPLYIAAPSAPWQSASYFSYVSANQGRTPMIYIGANDGMLHAFNAVTGNEVFAYVPHSVWSNLIKLVNPYYNEQHWFYVDGSPSAGDVQFADTSWHTVLFGSEAAGGNSIFALDITSPSNFTSELNVANAALWEFSDANMGLTYSQPVPALTSAGFTVVFGNGYNSPTGQPYLYFLNPQTGALISKINLCAAVAGVCNAALTNGLSGVTVVNPNGLPSQPSDVVYAGDLQGNLWRVNISNSNPANWTVSVLFQARDSLGNPQPITVPPAVSLNPLSPQLTGTMVYFGTGQFLALSDLSNNNVQSVYGVFDSGAAPALPLLRANLQAQTLTSVSTTTTGGQPVQLRQLSANPVLLPAVKGWRVDLNLAAGERVVTQPTLFNGTVQVVSYQPNTNICTAGGQSWYMVFNYATGGATTLPQFDWNGSNSVTSADLYNGLSVAGVSLGTAYSAAPKLITGVNGAMAYTTSGQGEITSGVNAGTCTAVSTTNSCIPGWANADLKGRGSWVEVR
jgi:type IV pilus assembly protein PilY1